MRGLTALFFFLRISHDLNIIAISAPKELLNYILPHISPSLLEVANTTGSSTPLHWAAVNSHLEVAKALVLHPSGSGRLLLNARNAGGLSPLGEAELAGADEVAKWFVEVMDIDQKQEFVEEGDQDEMEMQASSGTAMSQKDSLDTAGKNGDLTSEVQGMTLNSKALGSS
ncbi:hypothetical protein FRC19_010676 [Serendipita sp. 401]|nr:hypothetical protein FRC19_010676 [Serendipita sp. 401]KAG9052993.1 hypothetical protein FS842_008921 [Serendipita sp. 407]